MKEKNELGLMSADCGIENGSEIVWRVKVTSPKREERSGSVNWYASGGQNTLMENGDTYQFYTLKEPTMKDVDYMSVAEDRRFMARRNESIPDLPIQLP